MCTKDGGEQSVYYHLCVLQPKLVAPQIDTNPLFQQRAQLLDGLPNIDVQYDNVVVVLVLLVIGAFAVGHGHLVCADHVVGHKQTVIHVVAGHAQFGIGQKLMLIRFQFDSDAGETFLHCETARGVHSAK